jgi:hypothetical protein
MQGGGGGAAAARIGADALFGMSDPVFAGDDLDLHEPMAGHLCLWMDEEKHHLWDYYRAWRGSVREEPTASAPSRASSARRRNRRTRTGPRACADSGSSPQQGRSVDREKRFLVAVKRFGGAEK